MMKADPRKTSVMILNRVERGGYAEPLIDKSLSQGGWDNIHDRRLLTQLVYGVLRMRGRLDWIVEKLYRGRFDKMETGLKNILRTGLFQILFMDRIPDHAAVDESVRLTGKLLPERIGLTNAILRNAIRTLGDIPYPELGKAPALHISVMHSHPLWLVEKWIGLFGVDETLAFCRANNENPDLCIRVNRIKASRESVLQALAEKCEARKTDFSPDGIIISRISQPIREMDLHKEGWFQIQDEASQLVSWTVGPQPGEDILDVCSGVGGKTTHLAGIMGGSGNILAVDISPDKLRTLEILAGRLGVAVIRTKASDATVDLGEKFHGRFDRILIDAPCSGLGTLRRNPEIKWRIREKDLENFPSLQHRILEQSRHYLKEGGILVYSTCTVMPEENENLIRDFLSRYPEFRPLEPPGSIPKKLVDGSGCFRTWPQRHGMDGFFAARLQKSSLT